MEDEIVSYFEEPWRENYDPWRDEPETSENDSIQSESDYDLDQTDDTEIESVESSLEKCACFSNNSDKNCSLMKTFNEQICCKAVKSWQKEFNTSGTNIS